MYIYHIHMCTHLQIVDNTQILKAIMTFFRIKAEFCSQEIMYINLVHLHM